MAIEKQPIFEWDPLKAWENQHKHHVTFEDAAHVFFDEDRIEGYDELHSIDEDRFYAIGLVQEVLFVIFTERHGGRITRIISARMATKEEEDLYYENGQI